MREMSVMEVASSSLPTWIMILVAVLVLITISTVLVVACQARRSSVREAFQKLLTTASLLAWMLPGVGILGYLAYTAAPQFEDGQPPPLSVETRELEVTDQTVLLTDDGLIPLDIGEIPSASPGSQRDTLPAWAQLSRRTVGEVTFVVLRSKQYVTIEEAQEELIPAVQELVQHYFHQAYGYKGDWDIPSDLLLFEAVTQRHEQEVERNIGTMHRVYLQVQLAPSVRDRFYGIWREQIVGRRLSVLGGFVGLATLMLTAVAGFFRLDTLTKGSHRLSLKLAALSLVIAGSLVASALLPHLAS